MGVLLFIVAYILHTSLRWVFWIYHVVQPFFTHWPNFKTAWEEVDRYHLHMAYAEDQAGSVTLGKIFNKLFTKGDDKFYFNDEDNSISYSAGMNYRKNCSPGARSILVKTLNFIDKDHDIKAIHGKIVRDIEALERLKAAGLVTPWAKASITTESWKAYVEHVHTPEARKFKPSSIKQTNGQ